MAQVADPRPVLREWTHNGDQFRLIPHRKVDVYEVQRYDSTDHTWEEWDLIQSEAAALVKELLEEK